jgi:hypothetical protein
MVGEAVSPERDRVGAEARRDSGEDELPGVPGVADPVHEHDDRPLGIALNDVVQDDARFRLEERRAERVLRGGRSLGGVREDRSQDHRGASPHATERHRNLLGHPNLRRTSGL